MTSPPPPGASEAFFRLVAAASQQQPQESLPPLRSLVNGEQDAPRGFVSQSAMYTSTAAEGRAMYMAQEGHYPPPFPSHSLQYSSHYVPFLPPLPHPPPPPGNRYVPVPSHSAPTPAEAVASAMTSTPSQWAMPTPSLSSLPHVSDMRSERAAASSLKSITLDNIHLKKEVNFISSPGNAPPSSSSGSSSSSDTKSASEQAAASAKSCSECGCSVHGEGAGEEKDRASDAAPLASASTTANAVESKSSEAISNKHDPGGEGPPSLKRRQKTDPPSLPSSRLQNVGEHFPSHSRKLRRCKWCFARRRKRRESTYACTSCGIQLCITPCFQEFHTEQ